MYARKRIYTESKITQVIEKDMKKIVLKAFNRTDTILVLTSYPSHEEKNNPYDAIAAYSKHILTSVSRTHPVLVLAEKTNDAPQLERKSKRLAVLRTWEKGNLKSLYSLISLIKKLNNIQTIYIPFEFNVFGGTPANLMLLVILSAARLMGKRVVFEAHQIIENVAELQNHIDIHNPLILKFLTFGIKQYYRAVGLISHNVIVFEEDLKQRLNGIISLDKVQVLSQPYTKETPPLILNAKKKLGIKKDEFVVLFFGFLNWYKGIDWLVNAFESIPKDKKIRLIVAGGANPYHKHRPYYQRYFKTITDKIAGDDRMIFTDFIPDDQISLYFSASDLMVMPYRVFMSASGPFSMALCHRTPLLLSDKLKRYATSPDFANALTKANLNENELFFPLKKKAFSTLIQKAHDDKKYLKKLTQFSATLSSARSVDKVTEKLLNCLFPIKQKAYKLAPRFVLQSS